MRKQWLTEGGGGERLQPFFTIIVWPIIHWNPFALQATRINEQIPYSWPSMESHKCHNHDRQTLLPQIFNMDKLQYSMFDTLIESS